MTTNLTQSLNTSRSIFTPSQHLQLTRLSAVTDSSRSVRIKFIALARSASQSHRTCSPLLTTRATLLMLMLPGALLRLRNVSMVSSACCRLLGSFPIRKTHKPPQAAVTPMHMRARISRRQPRQQNRHPCLLPARRGLSHPRTTHSRSKIVSAGLIRVRHRPRQIPTRRYLRSSALSYSQCILSLLFRTISLLPNCNRTAHFSWQPFAWCHPSAA